MARRLRYGLNQALQSGSLESHATLELSLPSDIAPAVNLYLATARVTIDGVTYDWQLRETGAVKTSLTRAADRTTVDIQNADTLFGVDMLRVADTLYGASAKLGRYWRDLKSGAEFHHPLLTGVVAGVEINETVVRLTLVSDMYSTVNVGATEPVQRKCRFQTQGRFRGTECGYSGALLTCNGLLDSADGCDGRHGSTLKRAKFGGFAYIESASTVSGAAALPVPAYNQAIRTAATDLGSYASPVVQQPFFAVNDETFNVTNDATNEQTVITPKGIPTKLYNAVFDYNAVADGVTNTTTELQAAIDAAEAAGGGTVFLQAGTYLVTGLTINGHVKLSGSSEGEVVIYSTTNAPIVDCGQTSFEFPVLENIKIRGDVTAGSSQIGLRVDDATYGLRVAVRNVWIENCGGAGLYVGNAFSSLFENIFSTNCAGGNYVINSANMPVLTFRHCDSGTIHSSYRTGYHIKAGYVVMRDCNSIYGGSNPEWCVTIGRRIGLYGETAANGSAFVRFEGCNFESSTVGGVQCLFNSRASFHACTWVGDGASSGSYKAVLSDACQVNPTETTGAISSGSPTLTVANAVTWTIGQGIKVAGAGVAGADLTTTVSNISGTTFTLAANASTTVSGAVVSHTDDIFYPLTQSVLGVIDDDCGFNNSPASYYANSEPIHVTAYPTTAGVIPPFATNGRGPKIAGDKFVSNFRNDTSSATWPLPRMDGFMPVQRITASTTYVGTGVRYIECDHSAPITITLPWPGWQLNSSNELIIIKDVSSAGAATNNITIQASSGGTVSGASSYVISADKGAVILIPHSADDYRVVSAYVPGSGISGSGSSTRLAYWSGASSLTSDADLTYDGFNLTAGRLYHSGGSAGAPGVASLSDSGTGFYLSSSGVYGFASSAANGGAGGNVLLLKGDRVTLNGNRVSWDASETVHDFIGSGSPEGVVTASIGSVYRRTDGGTSTTLYVKESGTGNTGWVANGQRQVQAVNVKTDYGATGDGSTNDGTAVNNALTAALAQGRPLYFPAGTYLGVNLTGITYQLKVFGDGPERTILKASAGNTPVIDIGNASSHTIEISDLTVEGAGNTSGSSGHGIYVHDQSDGLFNFFVNNVWVKNCGGDGIHVRGQFTNKFKSVFVSNCGGNGFDVSGGNTVLFDSCYVDDVLNNKVAYRIRAGQAVMLNCNGLDSLGSVSDWAVIGQAIADGDPADSYCALELIGCNVESFKRYGVWAKVGSRVSAKATFFTTSASGSAHIAIKTDFTDNQPGTIDSLCRFSTQGSGTWANGYAIHTNSDIPVLAIGRTDVTEFYSDAAATARSLPSVGVTPISTVPHVYVPKLATDSLLYPTDNTGDIGATGANRPRDLNLGRDAVIGRNVTVQNGGQITQSGSVAGFLGLTATNSSSSGQAGIYGVNHSGKNVFIQVFQDGTGIAQIGSDHFPIYIKAAGTNRWYFDNLLFSPLQDDTSDLGAGSTRIKDAFLSGSLNLKERSTPGTPAANTVVLYAKDNGGTSALYFKDDAGTETQVGAGGGGGASGADPTASVGLSTTNGVATTFMRSDAAPALSQAIAPTWTATHTFNSGTTPANVILLDIAALGSNGTRNSHTIIQRGRSRDSGTPHTIDWRTQTIVSSNAGASQYEISYEIDSGGYTAMLIIADDGSVTGGDFIGNVFTAGSGSVLDSVVNAASGYTVAGAAPSGEYLRGNGTEFVSSALNGGDLSAGSVTNAKLANSAITIAGTSTSLGGSISQDTITGLSSTGLVKRTGANTLTTATGGTDYEVPLTFSTGLTRSTNTITVNTTQNIAKLSNLTTNGVITTTGGDGTLVVDDNALDYLYSLSCS